MRTSPTTTISSTTSSPTAIGRVPLRLRLDHDVQAGPVDGAWWPQSRDLRAEVADLVDHLPGRVGRIQRLLFSRPDWDVDGGVASIHRIQAARGAVKVGSFPSDDTHVMVVTMASGQRLRLLVVPWDTEPGTAERVMAQAADEHNTESPGALLGLTGPDQSEIGHAVWN